MLRFCSSLSTMLKFSIIVVLTLHVIVVIHRWGGFWMLFKPSAKFSFRCTNMFFTAHHATFVYVVPPISSGRWYLCPLGDQEVSDGFAFFKMHLYAMFAADVFAAFTKHCGVWHHYVYVLNLCWAVTAVTGIVIGDLVVLLSLVGPVLSPVGVFAILQYMPTSAIYGVDIW